MNGLSTGKFPLEITSRDVDETDDDETNLERNIAANEDVSFLA